MTQSTMPISLKRSVAIDFLRAVAVILVLFRHAPPSGAIASPITRGLEVGGWIGVNLFFVLSGYLVSGLIWKEIEQTQRFDVTRFLIRRGLKIYPAFYAMITFSLIIYLVRFGHINYYGALAEIFFVQNYFPGLWNHTWSLAVEEHFYLLLAFFAWFFIKIKINTNTWIFILCGSSVLVCLALRSIISNTPYTHETHLFPTHLRIDALALGVMLKIAVQSNLLNNIQYSSFTRVLLILLSCLACSWAFFFPLEKTPWITSIGHLILSVSSLMLIIALDNWPTVQRSAFMAYIANIGVYSYSIYLWHIPLELVTHGILKRMVPNIATEFIYVSYFFVAIVGGMVLGKLIELPVLRLRDHWFPSKSSPKVFS